MRVVAKPRLRKFWETHKGAERPLQAWWKLACSRDTDWKNINDVKSTFPGVDGFNLDCGVAVVVFNIGGNKFRLVATIDYAMHLVFVKAVLTHKEYGTNKWKEQICQGLI